jgi:hypothetical protein
MGFNPALAPYTVIKEVNYQTNTDTDTFSKDHFLFRFPFAGQLINSYAALGQGAAVQAGDDKTTNLWEVSIWKNSVDNTTATYATGDRAAARTGEPANTTGALIWGANRVYALTNKSTARRRFAAGDKMFLRTSFTAATTHNITQFALQQEKLEVQMDYIIGYDSGATPGAGTGPA